MFWMMAAATEASPIISMLIGRPINIIPRNNIFSLMQPKLTRPVGLWKHWVLHFSAQKHFFFCLLKCFPICLFIYSQSLYSCQQSNSRKFVWSALCYLFVRFQLPCNYLTITIQSSLYMSVKTLGHKLQMFINCLKRICYPPPRCPDR